MNMFDISVDEIKSKYRNIINKINGPTSDDELTELASDLNGIMIIMNMRGLDIPKICIECMSWNKEYKEVKYISEYDVCYHDVCLDCFVSDEVYLTYD